MAAKVGSNESWLAVVVLLGLVLELLFGWAVAEDDSIPIIKVSSNKVEEEGDVLL